MQCEQMAKRVSTRVPCGVPVEQESMVGCLHVLHFSFHAVFWAGNVFVQSQLSQCFLGIHVRFSAELGHSGRNTLSTMVLKPRRSRRNNEGASGREVEAAVQEAAKTRVLGGRFLKGLAQVVVGICA